jgi:drug/metabolite transporter (DMT)-like permease
MGNKRSLAYLGMSIVVIAWGISFLNIKVVVAVLPPMTFSLLRFTMASIILFTIFKIKEPKTRLDKKDIFSMAFSGILGLSIYFFFENSGVKLTTASTASIIIATLPVFTIAADAIVYGYKLNLMKVLGIVLSVAGVCFVAGISMMDISGSGLGFVYMFGAVISWVIYNFVTRPLTKKYTDLAITTYQMIFGTIVLIPFLFIEKTDWHAVNSTLVLNLVFLGVICSALANWLYVFSIQNIGVSITSLFLNIVPVVTVIASFFVFKERIGIMQIIGGAAVISSVFLVNMKDKKESIETAEENA